MHAWNTRWQAATVLWRLNPCRLSCFLHVAISPAHLSNNRHKALPLCQSAINGVRWEGAFDHELMHKSFFCEEWNHGLQAGDGGVFFFFLLWNNVFMKSLCVGETSLRIYFFFLNGLCSAPFAVWACGPMMSNSFFVLLYKCVFHFCIKLNFGIFCRWLIWGFHLAFCFVSLFVSISHKVGSEISSLISSSVYRSCMQTRTQRHLRKSSPHTPRKRMTSSPTSSLPTPCTLEQLGREWGHLRRRGPAPSDSLPHSLLLWWHFEPNYQHLTRLLQWHKRKPNWDLMNAFAVY